MQARARVLVYALAGPSRSVAACRQCRGAATAAAAVPDEDQAAKLRQRHEHFKGKAREEEWERYRFPKGRNPSPYEVLHLQRDAGGAEVKERYYRLARLYHPDSSHPDANPANFLTLNKAYKLLSSSTARSQYLRTGYGWSATNFHEPSPYAEMDSQMRNEIHFRRRAAAGMHPRAHNSAWGGFRGDGGFDPYDDMENHGLGPNPRRWEGRGGSEEGKERYMTNGRFLSWVGALSVVFAWIQYHRLGQAASDTRMALDRQHLGASHALAEARHEAALYGRQRRERIRRKLREKEVDKEYERLEALHGRIE